MQHWGEIQFRVRKKGIWGRDPTSNILLEPEYQVLLDTRHLHCAPVSSSLFWGPGDGIVPRREFYETWTPLTQADIRTGQSRGEAFP